MDWKRWDTIPGWFNELEGKYLYETVLSLPEKSMIVEIGSFRGRSTVALLQACKDSSSDSPSKFVKCVDNFSGTGEVAGSSTPESIKEGKRLLRQSIDEWGLLDWWIGIEALNSQEWFDKHPDVLYRMFFIDGCHLTARYDVTEAWKRLLPRGILLCHDYDINAPGRVVVDIDAAGLPGHHIGVKGTSLWKAIKR